MLLKDPNFSLLLVIFQPLLLSTYVDSIYLVRVTPPMNFTFSDDSLFLKKIRGGGHKFSEFACFFGMQIKTSGLLGKIRVGRETGNTHIFFWRHDYTNHEKYYEES